MYFNFFFLLLTSKRIESFIFIFQIKKKKNQFSTTLEIFKNLSELLKFFNWAYFWCAYWKHVKLTYYHAGSKIKNDRFFLATLMYNLLIQTCFANLLVLWWSSLSKKKFLLNSSGLQIFNEKISSKRPKFRHLFWDSFSCAIQTIHFINRFHPHFFYSNSKLLRFALQTGLWY